MCVRTYECIECELQQPLKLRSPEVWKKIIASPSSVVRRYMREHRGITAAMHCLTTLDLFSRSLGIHCLLIVSSKILKALEVFYPKKTNFYRFFSTKNRKFQFILCVWCFLSEKPSKIERKKFRQFERNVRFSIYIIWIHQSKIWNKRESAFFRFACSGSEWMRISWIDLYSFFVVNSGKNPTLSKGWKKTSSKCSLDSWNICSQQKKTHFESVGRLTRR